MELASPHLIAQGIPESRALNILSLGFALGLLIGRVGVSPILIRVPAITVSLPLRRDGDFHFSDAAAEQSFHRWQLWSSRRPLHGAGFPHHSRHRGYNFPRMTGTAIGFAITCGWIGLAVSSRIIGFIAGGDPRRLKRALLVIPASAVLMVVLDLAIQHALR